MPRLAFSDWTAEQLRCTLFVLPGTSLPANHWWTKLAGSDPEQVTSNPRIGFSQAAGSFELGTLIVTTQPGRLDWFLVPSEATSIQGQVATEPVAPSLGGAVGAIDVFSKISRQSLTFEDIPDVNRLALGGVFSHPETDKRAAYMRLPDYVPVNVDPESTDFLYQINLPRKSRLDIDGLMINRLTKWSVTMIKLFTLKIPTDVLGHEVQTTITLRSEIDINTPQEFQGVLPKGRLVELFDELIDHGRNLIANGVAQQ